MDKQSDCGEFNLLKCEYQVLKLKEIATIKARIGWQGLKQEEHLEQGDYYLITGTDFVNGSIDFERCKFISKERYIQDKNIQIKNGDILVTKDGTLGKVAYVEGLNKPATLNSGVFVIRVNENKVLSKYLFQYLSSNKLMNFVRTRSIGGTVQHLNQSVIVEFPILFPSIDNQNKIITILSTQDKVIELKEKLLKEKEKQKKYLMQNLLTGRKRLKGFNDEWTKVKLFEILKPGNKVPVKDTSMYTKITVKLNFKGLDFANINRNMIDSRPFYIRNKDEIIIGKQNYFNGSVAIVDSKYDGCICSNAIMSFSVKNSNLYFVYSYITQTNFLKKYEHLANGTGQKELSEKEFLNFEIILPSIEEQKAIAEILTTADKELKLLQEELEEEKRKKKVLMQLLLTGIVRISL